MNLYREALLAAIQKKRDLKFVTSVLAGIQERHAKYGNSVKLLEPNIKNSAGTLRDVHSLLWIFRATDIEYFSSTPFHCNESSCRVMFELLEQHGLTTRDEHNAIIAALNFLLRVRHEMHFLKDDVHDTLEFALQRDIAAGLGYSNVELFMRDYYLHARAVYRINQRIVHHFRETPAVPFWKRTSEQVLDEIYILRSGEVTLRNTSFAFTFPEEIVRGFYWCGMFSTTPSQSLLAHITALTHSPEFFNPAAIARKQMSDAFLSILTMKENIAATLSQMNDCDVLGKCIPEWGNLVAYFQHSMYHYYTVDAHTLIAMKRAEKLLKSNSVLGDVYHRLERRELLHLAILFHDIEKPNGNTEHDVRGANTARAILQRLNISDPHDDVGFLIHNHLVMEQIAFRRNTSDPKTIAEFATLFRRPEQLKMLFILTYCDLSAVNKNVWSNWKEIMLQELYSRTLAVVEKNLSSSEAAEYHESEYRALVESVVAELAQQLPIDEVRSHISSIENHAYIHTFSAAEIAEHLRVISTVRTVAVVVNNEATHSAITMFAHDAPFLLSTLCGVLTANDANIFDAHIFTRDDGIVIDQFRVTDTTTKSFLSEAQFEKIQADVDAVLQKKETLEHLFERHHRKWRRKPKPLMHPNIRIDAVFHETEKYTIIDVFAPDTSGFLYKITQALSKLHLQIHFAKIGTRGDGIVDTFYVLDEFEQKITDTERKQHIRERVLHTIDQLINVQLTS